MEAQTVPRPLLTRQELAHLLRVSLSTVDRLRARGVIRPVQLARGGAVRFRADEVERLLDAPSEPVPARPDELDWR